jgi:hypothetical protein
VETLAFLLQQDPAWLTLYLATLNTGQVLLLAWIGIEQRASALERERRKREEHVD